MEKIDIIKDKIGKDYNDFNYQNHMIIDTTPTEEDFLMTVIQYYEFERRNAIMRDFAKEGKSDEFINKLMKL